MSRQVELGILVTAKNLASRALGQVKGDVNAIDRAGRQAGSNLGRNLAVGGAIAAGVIATNVKAGIDSLVELERVNNLTAAALKSTGNAANQSVEGIRARSEEMERMSGVDDKVIQNAQNLLLTFANIHDDAFEPTLEAAVNLNAALGGGDEGLQGTLLQVAKAVNDPVRGMTQLRRVGVSFTDAQIKQVKAMVEANDLMGAQGIVLGELEKQFGGAAEAANQGAAGAQKRFADAIEDIQMSLATGFLPLIERVSDKMSTLVADPAFLAGVQDFGETLAGAFDSALDFAESIPWDAVGSALSTAGAGAKMAMDAFLSAPAWLQTAILTGWGLNKVTGGVLGSLVGELGKGLIRGVLGMNAGVVNVSGAVVNAPGGGVGGAPVAGGKGGKGGGFGGGLLGLLGAVGVAAIADAVEEPSQQMAQEIHEAAFSAIPKVGVADLSWPFGPKNTPTILPEVFGGNGLLGGSAAQQPRTSTAPVPVVLSGSSWEQQRRSQAGTGNVVSDRLASSMSSWESTNRQQLGQLNNKTQTAAQVASEALSADRSMLSTARLQTTHLQSVRAQVANQGARLSAIEGQSRTQSSRLASIHAIESGNSGKLSGILAKKSSVTAIINTSVNVNLQQWQRAQVSSIRANSNSGGFI